jgi:hypothetical protein
MELLRRFHKLLAPSWAGSRMIEGLTRVREQYRTGIYTDPPVGRPVGPVDMYKVRSLRRPSFIHIHRSGWSARLPSGRSFREDNRTNPAPVFRLNFSCPGPTAGPRPVRQVVQVKHAHDPRRPSLRRVRGRFVCLFVSAENKQINDEFEVPQGQPRKPWLWLAVHQEILDSED